MSAALEKLQREAPHVATLAVLASISGRVDRVVLRALRLGLLPAADATAESDLWFSDIIARRSSDVIALHDELLPTLRARLAASGQLPRARDIVGLAHAGAPPLLLLEEDLIFLGLTGASVDAIEQRLGEVVATFGTAPDRRRDIAGWALHSLPRLPEAVRATAAAWSLAFAAESALGYAVSLSENPPDGALFLDTDVPSVPLAVGPSEKGLLLGVAEGPSLTVPATTPRIVTIESAAGRQIAAIAPGRPQAIELPAGEAVLTNLRGERWRVRTFAADAYPDRQQPLTAAANGRWILIDGGEPYRLPYHYYIDFARQLGASLAQAGFSLLTLGTPGPGSAAAEGFWQVLSAQGYPTGRIRLLHVVGADQRPGFTAAGRVLSVAADAKFRAAVARSEAVLMIGGYDWSQSLRDAAYSAGVPLAVLLDGQPKELEPMMHLPPAPELWDADAVARHLTEIMRLLGEQLRVEPPSAPPQQQLLHQAALALDAATFREFEAGLQRLTKAVRAAPELAEARWYERQQPWQRVLGYLAAPTLSVDTQLEVLQIEQSAVQFRQETRTLWIVLDLVEQAIRSQLKTMIGGEERLLAAVCATLRTALESLQRDDDSQRCQSQLSALAAVNPASQRAEALAQQAARYAAIREGTKTSDERTATLDDLLNNIAFELTTRPAMPEAGVWWRSGTPGERVVALGLLLGAPEPAGFGIIEEAIRNPRSSFEQFTALRAAQAVQEQLATSALIRLRDVLHRERSQPDGSIAPSDAARWSLSEILLNFINGRFGSAGSDVAQLRQPAGTASTTPSAPIDFLIIAPLQKDLQALLQHLPEAQRIQQFIADTSVYHGGLLPFQSPDGVRGQYQVIVLSPMGMGRVQSALATAEAIGRFKPRYVLLVGAAGGVESRVALGDVVIADQIIDYEQQKLTEDGPQVRYQAFRADTRLLSAAQSLSGWEREVSAKRPRGGTPRLHIGNVASGDKLFASPKDVSRYREDWPQLIAFEMEAAGVAQAALQAPQQLGMLVIRGIADLADSKKGDMWGWQTYACDAAAAVLVALLRSGPVPRAAPRPEGSRQANGDMRQRAAAAIAVEPAPPATKPRLRDARNLIYQVLPTDSDFEAFCLDYFPGVYRKFSAGMHREAKLTLLLEREDVEEVLGHLREAQPTLYAHFEHLIKA